MDALLNYFNIRKTELKPAAIGPRSNKVVNLELRSDAILWLEEDDPELNFYFKLIQSITDILKRDLFLPIRQTETQMAYYTKDQFYDRHRDRHFHSGHRWVTAVYYLNQNWSKGHGGELVIYKDLEPNAPVIIEPISNRLVLFLSELEHEVKVTNVTRKSFTTWFRDDIK